MGALNQPPLDVAVLGSYKASQPSRREPPRGICAERPRFRGIPEQFISPSQIEPSDSEVSPETRHKSFIPYVIKGHPSYPANQRKKEKLDPLFFFHHGI